MLGVVSFNEMNHGVVYYFGLAISLPIEGYALCQIGVYHGPEKTSKVAQETSIMIGHNGTQKAEVCRHVLEE